VGRKVREREGGGVHEPKIFFDDKFFFFPFLEGLKPGVEKATELGR
jgi:hypothetical protein